MTKNRIAIPENIRLEVISKSNNRCCVCQTPFIIIHHLDETPSNNTIGNLIPLCPNCHNQVHSHSNLTVNLTATRIEALRDKWFDYCERRRDNSGISPNAILKLKNLVRSMGWADYGWTKSFAVIDIAYKDMSREQIIEQIFATSNRDDLLTYLETVKYMYQIPTKGPHLIEKFTAVCNAFGINHDELD
jgi:hypothetical protein